MKKPFWRNIFLGIVVGLIAGLVGFYFFESHLHALKQIIQSLSVPKQSLPDTESETKVLEAPQLEPIPQTQAKLLEEKLKSVVSFMKTSNSPEANFKMLLELEKMIKEMPKEEAKRVIVDFLSSKEDVATRLNFILDPNGFLETAPTFRTFLLDQLAEVDPYAAQQYARIILEAPESADEWAVALRNYAWGNNVQGLTHNDPYFHEKLNVLLNNKEWLKDPSVGFLQAFDAVVYSNDAQFVPRLAQLGSPNANNPAVEYAARLALTRMADQDFPQIANQLISDPELKNQPELRASILDRADLSEVATYNIIEDYLTNPSISPEEKKAFMDGFPSIVDIHSHNLLTKQEPKPLSQNGISDTQALKLINQLLADPSNKDLKYSLEQLKHRLEEYVQSYQRGLEQNRLQEAHRLQESQTSH